MAGTGRLSLGEVAEIVRPVRCGEGALSPSRIGTVTTDSREVEAGSFFVALPGEKVDGADFVVEALERGACGAVVSEDGARKLPSVVVSSKPVFVVADPLHALGEMARAHRRRFASIPLVGITGSSGKTTTKEFLAALLSRGRSVLKNRGNRNNLVGLPLTLLGLSDEHDVAVLEMGTNRPGEIARLADIAAPNVGVVTSIAPAHIEGLGSLEGVGREKGDLFRSLGPSGTAVVNATDLRVVREAGRCQVGRKIFFGVAINEVAGRIVAMDETGMTVVIRTSVGEFESRLPVPGEHNLLNALAAAAAAHALGITPADMTGGFAKTVLPAGRSRIVVTKGGGMLIDDGYNANPASMEAGVRMLASLRRERRAVAVLGDMLELGAVSVGAHNRVGHVVAGTGVDRLYAFGPLSAEIARGAVAAGLSNSAVVATVDRGELLERIMSETTGADAVLVKGSRGMRLDEVVAAIERERT